MKMVTSSNTSDSAPLPTASAGEDRLCPNVQLGRVVLHPLLHVVVLDQLAVPVLALLRVSDVGGQVVRKVSDAVDQRVTERE